jgi:hypothetical protein
VSLPLASIIERDGPLPLFAEGAGWDAAQAALRDRGLADGLPQVVPTVRRLEAMLAGVRDPEQSLGMMPPLFGDLTPANVAYCCVMAGCVPAELPVVLAAAEACLADDFNLLGLLTTTGTPAVAVMVSGPAVAELGLNAGTNTLGPGNRANACIGRALALVTRIIGGAVEGSGDMATMGQPGKYGFCFAEGTGGLLPSLASRRGLPPEASAVTVFGVSGTMEVLPLEARDTPEAVLTPVAAAMIASAAVAGSGKPREPGEQVVLIPPELLETLARHGWGVSEIQDFLFETVTAEIPGVASVSRHGQLAAGPSSILPIETGGPGVKMTLLPLWAGGSLSQTLPLR